MQPEHRIPTNTASNTSTQAVRRARHTSSARRRLQQGMGMRGLGLRLGRPTMIALIAVFLLAGVAYASIPDSSGVIHACYVNYGNLPHVVRVIDTDAGQKCTSQETALTWNQTGPQGPAGAQGPQGSQGPQGPAGPVTVVSTRIAPYSFSGTLAATVATLNLGAGSYILQAKIQVISNIGSDVIAICDVLDPSGAQLDDARLELVPGNIPPPASGVLELLAPATLSAGTVSILCTADGATVSGTFLATSVTTIING